MTTREKSTRELLKRGVRIQGRDGMLLNDFMNNVDKGIAYSRTTTSFGHRKRKKGAFPHNRTLNNRGLTLTKAIPVSTAETRNQKKQSLDMLNQGKVVAYPFVQKNEVIIPVNASRKSDLMRMIYESDGKVKSLRNEANEVVGIRFRKGLDSEAPIIDLETDFRKAGTLDAIINGYKRGLSLLKTIFRHNNGNVMIRQLTRTVNYFKTVGELQELFNVTVEPGCLSLTEEHKKIVKELHILFIKKNALRTNDRLSSVGRAEIIKDQQGHDCIACIKECKVNLFDNFITYYTVNVIFNAILTERDSGLDEGASVTLKDTDLMPMFTAYTGHLTREEAEKMIGNIGMADLETLRHSKKLEEYSIGWD
ncbi:MAG: hypothetical protein IJ682_04315 [Lachnospiraceae bacterium]|nr:hypothetical protein [Lachnospiraceae bacterium]